MKLKPRVKMYRSQISSHSSGKAMTSILLDTSTKTNPRRKVMGVETVQRNMFLVE